MATVNQRVLNWLYSVLTGQYQDVDRTYNDTAQALSHYSSLSPKTEVYTYENGTSALLLQLSGTLPVSFRGATYRFPVIIWVPQQYPRVEPMVYVTPSDGLVVRAGQHVDPQGRVYHPYLARWADHSDKSNILDFLAILRDVFAKEPPVVSRQPQQQPMSSPRPQSIPPPLPPLPPDIARSSAAPSSASGGLRPPPPPPKPHAIQSSRAQPLPPSRTNTGPPPLPPLPPSPATPRGGQAAPYQTPPQFSGVHQQHTPARQSSLRYESAPPLPLHTQPHQQPQQGYRNPPPILNQYQGPPLPQYHGPPQPSHHRGDSYGQPQQMQIPHPDHDQQPQSHQPPPQMGYPPNTYHQQQTPQQQQPKPKATIPDLLDDSPAMSPPSVSNLPVPPVPRNPEKDMLLHQIAQRLYDIRQAEIAKHGTTLQSLSAQRDALNNALAKLQQESSSLTAMKGMLDGNQAALNESLARADQLIKKVPKLTPPSIDDLLVAPTVVANQLYDLVAEEKALGDAIFNLGRAVEKGRIEPQVFVKMVRGLARELFTKKMLIRKCSRGMGLDDGRESEY